MNTILSRLEGLSKMCEQSFVGINIKIDNLSERIEKIENQSILKRPRDNSTVDQTISTNPGHEAKKPKLDNSTNLALQGLQSLSKLPPR